MNRSRFALMAGGGTAGHLQPALAIAEALVDRGHARQTIEFVGSTRGQDRATLEGRGYPFTLLPGRGIARSWRPQVLARNIGAVVGLGAALVRALAVVRDRDPAVVVAVGGYASIPAGVAAVVLRIPLVLVNVDAVPGAANRILGRFARAAAVGWEGTPMRRAVVTGTPVRSQIGGVDRTPEGRRSACEALGVRADRQVVAVFGGSLGARSINRAVDDLCRRWAERSDLAIYHIVGRRDWQPAMAAGAGDPPDGLQAVRVEYEERMPLVYAAADVVVSRAGAMTVAELSLVGVPSVLIPLPGAPGDHQTANAKVLERAGGATMITDAECDGDRLAAVLDPLLSDRHRLGSMGRAAASVGHPDAADAGARVVEEHARRRPPSDSSTSEPPGGEGGRS